MCHGSVGLVARALEAAGIATVSVGVRPLQHRIEAVGVPRLLITPQLMGRTIGRVGDRPGQRAVVDAALDLFETASRPGQIVQFAEHRAVPGE